MYSYSVPDTMDVPAAGMRVVVPLGNKQIVGIIACNHREKWDLSVTIRDIIAVLDTIPVVTGEQLKLWRWIADYYLCSIGDVMNAALPLKIHDRQYSLSPSVKRRVHLSAYTGVIEDKHPLTEAQQRAYTAILDAWQSHDVVLLQGVTSSGKTEVYIHLIEQQLQQGNQVLYLVPEIALTTQLTDRLQHIFGSGVWVYHSRVSDAQRVELYRQLVTPEQSGQGRLIVGARSAVFLPLNRLGMIIVDEEHEVSYKQQDPSPRYHARAVAIMLGRQYHAKVLLGSATPSIDSRYNAESGKFGYVTLTERYAGIEMPHITLIDLKRQYHRKEMYGHFSDPLVAKMRQTLAEGKQIILFQNRRGFAPYVQCTQCGAIPKCDQCDVSLTLHKSIRSLTCHYCGHTIEQPAVCPVCGGELKVHGFGTERLEDEVKELFPEVRLERMDLDTTRKKDDYQLIINRFSCHEADILIGTQMVTKGLDFRDVGLVAVLNADGLCSQPDYRSYERAFQMLEQVSGRAGRAGKQGEVIIQTFDPDNPIYDYLVRHDVEGLYHQQIEERKQFLFPPFHRQITLIIKHTNSARLEVAARVLRQRVYAVFGSRCTETIKPVIARVQNYYIRHLHLRIEANANIVRAKQMLMEQIDYVRALPDCKGVSILTDVDPMG